MFDEQSISSEEVASTSHSGNSKTDGNRSATSESFEVAKAETRAVNRSKFFILVFITAAAAVVGVLVWIVLNTEEINRFRGEVSTPASLSTSVSPMLTQYCRFRVSVRILRRRNR